MCKNVELWRLKRRENKNWTNLIKLFLPKILILNFFWKDQKIERLIKNVINTFLLWISKFSKFYEFNKIDLFYFIVRLYSRNRSKNYKNIPNLSFQNKVKAKLHFSAKYFRPNIFFENSRFWLVFGMVKLFLVRHNMRPYIFPRC